MKKELRHNGRKKVLGSTQSGPFNLALCIPYLQAKVSDSLLSPTSHPYMLLFKNT